MVQPVAIAYTGVHGMAMGRYFRPIASWPGDVELMPHLKGILHEGAIDVEVRFGEPVVVTAKTDRKALARTMENRVRSLLQSALLGREIPKSDNCSIGRSASCSASCSECHLSKWSQKL